MIVFWGVALCSLVEIDRLFRACVSNMFLALHMSRMGVGGRMGFYSLDILLPLESTKHLAGEPYTSATSPGHKFTLCRLTEIGHSIYVTQ
jgi:hypothetical protein